MPDQNHDSQHCATDPYEYEADEINLLELLLVLLKYKWLICAAVILTGISAVLFSLQMPNIYQSSATIARVKPDKFTRGSPFSGSGLGILRSGGGSSFTELEVMLESRGLSKRIIEKYNLMPTLFEAIWDTGKKEWLSKKPPSEQDAIDKLNGWLEIENNRKKQVLYVKINHREPKVAKQVVEYYLTELSETLREKTLHKAEEKIIFLQKELGTMSDPLLKEKIFALMSMEIEKKTLARAQKYYNFDVIDMPLVPDLNKKSKPKRSRICILSVVVAFFLAVFLSYILEFIHNSGKNADPEQLNKFYKYMGRKKRV